MDNENLSLMGYEGCDKVSDGDSGKPTWKVLAQELINGGFVALIFAGLGEDVFDKHGWSKVGDFCEFLASATLFVTASVIVLNYWKRPFVVWPSCCLLSIGVLSFLILSDFSVDKPYSHFTFGLRTTDSLSDTAKLTNDFLIAYGGDLDTFVISGRVVMPLTPEQTNVCLTFTVTPSAFLQDAEIVVRIPKDWECVPEFGWQRFISPDNTPAWTLYTSSGLVTNDVDSFSCRVSSVFGGDTIDLPKLTITQIPKLRSLEFASIMAKPKDWPLETVSFVAFFPRISSPPGLTFQPIPLVMQTNSFNLHFQPK